jgi:hypothetical protein
MTGLKNNMLEPLLCVITGKNRIESIRDIGFENIENIIGSNIFLTKGDAKLLDKKEKSRRLKSSTVNQ